MQVTQEKSFWLIKLLRYAVYAAAFVPLIIFKDFVSPFHFGKIIIFRSLVEIMAVFYFILILKDRNYLPKKHLLLIIFGLFTFVFGVSTVISVNPYLSFWGSLERMGGWWSFLHYLVYFVILISVFRTREDWLCLLKIMVSVGVLSAFYGFGQRTNISFFVGSGGRDRIFGTIGNPALFAGYQLVNLFMALTLALSSYVSRKQKPFLFFAAAINTVAVLMSAVRGSILGLGVGFLVFAFLYFYSSKSQAAKRVLVGLIALAVLFTGFTFAFKNSKLVKSSGYLSRITDLSFNNFTVKTRFWAWRAGLEGWIETPKTVLFGWGPENFNVPFSKHFNPNFFQGLGSETLFDRAHNMFVEVLVTMGLLAFLIYVAMFVAAYRLIWVFAFKHQRIYPVRDKPPQATAATSEPWRISNGVEKSMGAGLIALITAYIIHNGFIFDTSANFLVFFTVLGFIVWLTSPNFSTRANGAIPQSGSKNLGGQAPNPHYTLRTTHYSLSLGQQTLMLILLVGAGFLIYRTNILQSEANYASTRGIVASWAGDTNAAVAKFKEALSYDVPGKYDYRHRYAQYVLELLSGKKIGDNETALLKDAIAEVQKNANESNEDYLPYLYISRAYIILGKDSPSSPYNDEALKNSMKALAISPNFVRTYYEVAQAYLNKKDYNNALKYFNQAADLNPGVGLTYWYLAAVYFETGDIPAGLAAVEKAKKDHYDFSEDDLLRLINYYLKLNDFAKISETYESLIRLKPTNPQYHASLAAAYARIGRIDDAVKEAQAAAELDKAFEPDAAAFIKSLGR